MSSKSESSGWVVGAGELVCDAVVGVSQLVHDTHEQVARLTVGGLNSVLPSAAAPAVRAADGARRVGTNAAFAAIHAVTGLVRSVWSLGGTIALSAGVSKGESKDSGTTLDCASTEGGELQGDTLLPPGVTELPEGCTAGSVAPPPSPGVPPTAQCSGPHWAVDALVGAVNGWHGDRLEGNRLRINMEIVGLPLTQSVRRVCVLVHGLASTDSVWHMGNRRQGHTDFGESIHKATGITALFLRYNSGLRIADNGKEFAGMLQALTVTYPAVEEIVLIGHSMGGLVVRSACHEAHVLNMPWLKLVQQIFCLGSPHSGSWLERFADSTVRALRSVDLPHTHIPAAIIDSRSAGIRDLRDGVAQLVAVQGPPVTDADQQAHQAQADPMTLSSPLPTDADKVLPCERKGALMHCIAGTLTNSPDHIVTRTFGDLLVQSPSALAPASNLDSFVGTCRTVTFNGLHHLDLQVNSNVCAYIIEQLTDGARADP